MKSLFTLLLFCFISPVLTACSCDCVSNVMTFCRFLHEEPDNFVEARVIQQDSILDGYVHSWQFELMQNFGTEQSVADTFWVVYSVVDFGCEVFFDIQSENIELGDTLFFNLSPPSEEGYHFLSYCDLVILHNSNDTVSGYFYYNLPNFTENYDEFINYVTEGYLTDYDCVDCSCYTCGFDYWPQFDFSTFCSSFREVDGNPIGRFEIIAKDDFSLTVLPVDPLYIFPSPPTDVPIKIWGTREDGDCRRNLDNFEVGKEYILQINRLAAYQRTHPDEQTGDFELQDCGIVHLDIEDEIVYGPINDIYDSMPYDQFVLSFQFAEMYLSDDCGWWVLGDETVTMPELKVYPNPTSDLLYIKSSQRIESMLIFNEKGIAQELNSSSNSVDVSNFPSGIYFLEMLIADRIVCEKIVVY